MNAINHIDDMRAAYVRSFAPSAARVPARARPSKAPLYGPPELFRCFLTFG